MKLRQYILVLNLVLYLQSNLLAGQTHSSQILMAYKATLIIKGEVVYLGKPNPKIITASPVNYQVVVFRVCEVLKGNLNEQFLKMNISFSSDMEGLSESKFGKGKRFILLLEQQKNPNDCVDLTADWKFEPTPDFQKYAHFPCYSGRPEATIEATDEEVKAVKKLIGSH